MKGGTSLPCRNHQIYVQETEDKTSHNTRKGPTTPVQSGLPIRAKTMTDMETHHIEYKKVKISCFKIRCLTECTELLTVALCLTIKGQVKGFNIEI